MDLPKRKRNRMEQYDYSLCGAYFVTICIANRQPVLWADINDINRPFPERLSETGKIVDKAINDIPAHYPDVCVDKYVIMPDHVHILIRIDENDNYRGIIKTTPNVGFPQENQKNPQNVGERIALPQEEPQNARDFRKNGRAMRAPTISTIINQMKGIVTKQIGFSIWQKSFHDHVIRNEHDYKEICRYIAENPQKYDIYISEIITPKGQTT